MRIRCAFGDTVLTDRWFVNRINRPLPPHEVSTEEIPSRDGLIFMSNKYGSYEIEMDIWIKAPLIDQPSQLTQIASVLSCEEPQRLWFSDEGERYRMAIPTGSLEVTRYPTRAKVTATFLVTEPVMYGKQVSVTVYAKDSLTFPVAGTYPTRPKIIVAEAIQDYPSKPDSLDWKILLDDKDVLSVRLPRSGANSVMLDCSERTCKVNGLTALPSLSSDWFELTPGMHKIKNFGSGSCVISWNERWL